MICRTCATGADVQTRVLEIEEDKTIPYGFKTRMAEMRKVGIALHTFCKGCDCQHKPVERGKNVQGGYPQYRDANISRTDNDGVSDDVPEAS